MKTNNREMYLELLRKEVVPALGCTEPIAVALAAAYAGELLGRRINRMEVVVSSNVLKNAMGVGIPGTGMIGLPIAAALGALAGQSRSKLEVLNSIGSDDLNLAKQFVEDGRITVLQADTAEKLYIRIECSNESDRAVALIRQKHDQLVLLQLNENILFEQSCEDGVADSALESSLSVKGIYDFAMQADFKDIEYILAAAEMNSRVAREGLSADYGLKVGKTIEASMKKNLLSNDLANYAMCFTAAATDARMAGCSLPVMSNSGSGNQGLSVMLPVVAVAEKLNVDQEKLARGLILANLIAIHMKYQLGRLAALCGVVIAASGASAAIVYLLGGDFKQIAYSIKNMIGNISGMICDGAKPGCAMKVATAVNAAVQSALLAINDIEISEHEGIIELDIEKTISNLTRIGSVGMEATDKMILDIMVCK